MSIANPMKFPGGRPSAEEFREWLAKAAPGDACVYFIGDLASVREAVPDVERLAKTVAAAASKPDNRLMLFQRRRQGPEQFAGFLYVAAIATKPIAEALEKLPPANIIVFDRARRNLSLARERVES